MTNAFHIFILTITIALAPLPTPAAPPDQVSYPSTGVVAAPLAADEQELVEYAYSRFAQAGIELPDVQIEFLADSAECFGYGGVYLPDELIVRICRPSKRTMVHELAHAWLETTFTAKQRDAFLNLRGLDAWTGGARWAQRGAEQAAEIVTWGVMEDNMLVRWLETSNDDEVLETWKLYKIPSSDPDQLSFAYEQLTGVVARLRLLDDPRTVQSVTETASSPEALRGR